MLLSLLFCLASAMTQPKVDGPLNIARSPIYFAFVVWSVHWGSNTTHGRMSNFYYTFSIIIWTVVFPFSVYILFYRTSVDMFYIVLACSMIGMLLSWMNYMADSAVFLS